MNKRVAIIANNSIEYLNKIIDIWNTGDVPVLIDFRIPLTSCLKLLKHAEVNKIYTDKKELIEYIKKGSEYKIEEIETMKESVSLLPDNVRNKYRRNYSKKEGLILFSSGTTGENKGIILSHYAITKNAENCAKRKKIDSSSVLYLYKTISHCASFIGEFLAALVMNAKIYIASEKLVIRKHLKNIDFYKITHFSANPSVLHAIWKNKIPKEVFSSLKLVVSSGAMFTHSCKYNAEIFFGCPIINMYGMTELAALVSSQVPYLESVNNIENDTIESVGVPLEGVEIKILNEKFIAQKTEEIGEIFICSPTMMMGYIGKENFNLLERKYWRTGDIGYFGKNKELYIVGRKDRMIISAGHNIFPESIERLVKEKIKLYDCYVTGVLDEALGNKIACVYCCDETLKENVQKEIHTLCAKNLASYEIPHYYIWKDKLNYTSSGKIIIEDIEQIKASVN